MSQEQLKIIWVCGINDFHPSWTPEEIRTRPYIFNELDTTDQDAHKIVLQAYADAKIDVLVHPLNHGYHYFGERSDVKEWKQHYLKIRHLNPKYPGHTLRITRKTPEERYDVSQWISKTPEIRPNWVKALSWFITKESRHENSTYLQEATKRVGLEKYFGVVRYGLCPLCKKNWGVSSFENHIATKHGGTLA